MSCIIFPSERPPRVLLIGLNPSQSSPDLSPFHKDTRSGKRIMEWVKPLLDRIDTMYCVNLCNEKTENNKQIIR